MHSGIYTPEITRDNMVQAQCYILVTRQIKFGFPMGVGGGGGGGAEVCGILAQMIDSGLVGFDQLCSGSSASSTPPREIPTQLFVTH